MDSAGGMNSCWPFLEHTLQLRETAAHFLPENLGGLTVRHMPHTAAHCLTMLGWLQGFDCSSGHPSVEMDLGKAQM